MEVIKLKALSNKISYKKVMTDCCKRSLAIKYLHAFKKLSLIFYLLYKAFWCEDPSAQCSAIYSDSLKPHSVCVEMTWFTSKTGFCNAILLYFVAIKNHTIIKSLSAWCWNTHNDPASNKSLILVACFFSCFLCQTS